MSTVDPGAGEHWGRGEEALPERWRAVAASWIEEGEQIRGWFEADLDPGLHYGKRLLLLTDRRVGALSGSPGDARPGATAWPLDALMEVTRREGTGLGTLDLRDGKGASLGCWRYTAARSPGAAAWESLFRGRTHAVPPGPEHGAPAEATSALGAGRSLARLWPFIRRRRGTALAGLSLSIAATAALQASPYVMMLMLDRVLVPWQQGDGEAVLPRVWPYLAAMGGAALVVWITSWQRNYFMATLSEHMGKDIRNAVFRRLQSLSLDFFGSRRTGDLVARVGSDTDRVSSFMSAQALDLVNDVLMIAVTVPLLVSINPALALVTLTPFPFVAWLVQRVRGRIRRSYARATFAWGEMVSVLTDSIPGIRVVKAFAQERREIERFETANRQVFEANDRVNRLYTVFGPTVGFLTEGGILLIWAFGSWLLVRGDLTVGVLVAFAAYLARLYARLESMSRTVAIVERTAAAAHRIFEVLDREPGVPDAAHPERPARWEGRIRAEGVRFSYGTREIIRGVDLEIRPGELVGFVGPSGAGKTTLINLVCRFIDPSEGVIRIDGVDARRLPMEEYRRHVGLVLQDPFLFYGTVAENIAYARPGASRAEIIAAARAARAHEFIMQLPESYDSLVGERGQSLSGGERQRISIARALIVDPKILILDEATSAVDNETESQIQMALEHLFHGRTTLAIAHRLSTLRRADRILVMDDGRIVETGTHAELLELNGVYARLHRAQMEMSQQIGI